MLDVTGVTVRFGGVTPLSDVSLRFDHGVCGLIGPNGAGKTTLLNVLSGFASTTSGSVMSDETDLLGMPPHRRARWGLRRTFQTEQIISHLSLADNVMVASEHTGSRSGRAVDVDGALDLVGLRDRRDGLAAALPTAQRRLLEIARVVVGSPRIVLLDEPGAGLTDAESAELVQVVGNIAEQTAALVILIDHDMKLVRATCATLAVLDFGKVIAQGQTETVLADKIVRRAYLGSEDLQ